MFLAGLDFSVLCCSDHTHRHNLADSNCIV
jgi:hypothetical protein